MKRFLVIFLIFIMVFIFSACKNSSTVVIGADGKEYELVEDKNSKDESASHGGIVVAGQDENGNAVTTVLSSGYLIVDNDTIKTSAYSYEIPKDFEIKSKGPSPLLENKQGTVQINIMDKTEAAEDFDGYVAKTYNSYEALGIVKEELKNVTISGIDMKRFAIEMQGDGESTLTTYTYAAQVGGRVLMITVTAKNGELTDAGMFDKYVAEIDFTKQ